MSSHEVYCVTFFCGINCMSEALRVKMFIKSYQMCAFVGMAVNLDFQRNILLAYYVDVNLIFSVMFLFFISDKISFDRIVIFVKPDWSIKTRCPTNVLDILPVPYTKPGSACQARIVRGPVKGAWDWACHTTDRDG